MKMASTTTYKPGQVVIVNVPFSNHSGVKPRPALVVSVEVFDRGLLDILDCPVSSQPRYYRNPGEGDIPLGHWQKPGLHYPSTVRISKLLSIDKQVIKGVLGSLSRQDFVLVKEGLREALGL